MAATGKESGLPDVNIPQWKRELILRKRASGRAVQFTGLTRPSVVLRGGFRGGGQVNDSSTSSAEVISPKNNFSSSSATSTSVVVAGSLRSSSVEFDEVSRGTMRILDECAGEIMVNRNSGVISDNIVRCEYSCRGSERKFRGSNGTTIVSPKLRAVRRPSMLRSRSVCSGAEVNSLEENGGANSDSSEEFQYGPGIVSKLKTKYLSMTLRENQKCGVRPSLSNLRRATSLENMLDEEPAAPKTINKFNCFNKYSKNNCSNKSRFRNNSNSMIRNDSMKRAQSMETLLQSEKNRMEVTDKKTCAPDNDKTVEPSVNKDIVILEKIPTSENCIENHTLEKAELPPPDVVKQTVKFFEPSATDKKPAKLKISKSTKPSEPALPNSNNNNNHNNISTAPVSKQIKRSDKPLPVTKPNLSPKPSPEKIHQNRLHKLNTPAKIINNSNPVNRSNFHTSTLKFIPTTPLISKPPLKSPTSTPETNNILPTNKSTSESTPVKYADDGESSNDESTERLSPNRVVPKDALDNIRKGGTSLSFKFKENENDCNSLPKSYLPAVPNEPSLKEVPTVIIAPQSISPNVTSVLPPKTQSEVSLESKVSPIAHPPVTHMKQVGVIRPIVSTRQQNHNQPNNMQQNHLTSQEKEKNLINEVKSIEQPVSKVVVAFKTLPSRVSNTVPVDISVHPRGCNSINSEAGENETKSVGLWDKKPWHHQQNTVVFNFSDRKDVPDYIENDGLIMRSNRDRAQTGGETGIIYLGRSRGGEESSTDNDIENESESGCDEAEISRCSVTFIGDNVLINGKSNLKKQAKREKLRIQFKDETTTYEYVSESALLEDMSPSSMMQNSAAVPSVLGHVSNLSSYTPSKAQLGTQEFQLGVTRASSNIHSNSMGSLSTAPSESVRTDESDYLKPAEDSETLTWSKGESADLLF